ncbi:MAG: S-layer homology domain-containing protein [Candidatus Ancillula sp.]|jgi:hypothetical protein|nr:S-layer homology domain-containing protein [Candidatus Ancillula sp.]
MKKQKNNTYGEKVRTKLGVLLSVFSLLFTVLGGIIVEVSGPVLASPMSPVELDAAARAWMSDMQGDGTQLSPKIIKTPDELAEIAVIVNYGNSLLASSIHGAAGLAVDKDVYLKLGNDIDLTDYKGVWRSPNGEKKYHGWNPIGDSETDAPFVSHFDGDNHVISNLAIDDPSSENIGLFGFASNAEIKNIEILNANIIGDGSVGILLGYATESTKISNSHATGNVKGDSLIGGLVGLSEHSSTISNSHATGSVISDNNSSFVGGLVGSSDSDSTVSNSYATSSVVGSNSSFVGGLVGSNDNSSTVSNSYATGDVTGAGGERFGGLVGSNDNGSVVSNSYATGNVKGRGGGCTGGLVGSSDNGSVVSNSYATGNAISNADYVGGLVGAVSDSGKISNSYATGNVEGANSIGGLVGRVEASSSLSKSYATGDVMGTQHVGGLVGGVHSNSIVIASVVLNLRVGTFDNTEGYSCGLVVGYLDDDSVLSGVHSSESIETTPGCFRAAYDRDSDAHDRNNGKRVASLDLNAEWFNGDHEDWSLWNFSQDGWLFPGDKLPVLNIPFGYFKVLKVRNSNHNGFQDIADQSTEFQNNIEWIHRYGITTGVTSSEYAPNESITRAQMMAFMYRAFEFNNGTNPTTTCAFDDISDQSQEFQDAICQMMQYGITTGVDAKHFAPNESVTRAQMMTFIKRAYIGHVPELTTTCAFDDISDQSQEFQDAICQMMQYGITTGVDAKHFVPNKPVTRAQMAAFINRAFNYATEVIIDA